VLGPDTGVPARKTGIFVAGGIGRTLGGFACGEVNRVLIKMDLWTVIPTRQCAYWETRLTRLCVVAGDLPHLLVEGDG
jgi:hypothetical protein